MENENIVKVLQNLRKQEKRKFEQTIDLIVNLNKFDIKRDSVNIFTELPHPIKTKKICAFFEVRNEHVDTVTASEFAKYSDKKLLKKLEQQYEFFIAQASLMPKVATTFGRVLGQKGKMPSPQLGVLFNVDEKGVKELLAKINRSIKLRTKEASIKIPIGKEGMKDEEIAENIASVQQALLKALPKGKDNIKNMLVKFTMSKPEKVLFA